MRYDPLALNCDACTRTWGPPAAASGRCAVEDQLRKSTPPLLLAV